MVTSTQIRGAKDLHRKGVIDMNFRMMLDKFRRVFLEQYLVLTIFSIIAAILILFMTGLAVFNTKITISDGDKTIRVLSKKDDVGEILTEHGITLGDYDVVTFGSENRNDISEIVINRAFEVPITADGKTVTVWATSLETVGYILDKADISIDDDDLINISVETTLEEGNEIVIQRVLRTVETKVTAIPYETENIKSSFYKMNTETVVTEGVDGELTTIAETTYIDGKLSAFNIISEEVTTEPVNEVIATGTAKRTPWSTAKEVELDENGIPVSYEKVITGKATAYSSKRQSPKGASGQRLYVGTVAVNPEIIPYGTELYIASTDGKIVYGYAVAADTGIALMDGRVLVDVFCDSYASSCKWGAHQVNVYILD